MTTGAERIEEQQKLACCYNSGLLSKKRLKTAGKGPSNGQLKFLISPIQAAAVVTAYVLLLRGPSQLDVAYKEVPPPTLLTGAAEVDVPRSHPDLRRPLATRVTLPCLVALPAVLQQGAAPSIRWSRKPGSGGEGEQLVLHTEDGAVHVEKAFDGRVSMPGYLADRYNASLTLTDLRYSDSGTYHCNITAGVDVQQDILPLKVTGKYCNANCELSSYVPVLLCVQSVFKQVNSHLIFLLLC